MNLMVFIKLNLYQIGAGAIVCVYMWVAGGGGILKFTA